ncbi:hypothetical protein [Lederbergia lenta]|uniref:hypothetical protein n=1 Tax=Lederbergia lenta TaxID=1467 RepID=UPI00203EE2F2|nr:hypothetical protein [Lederbergia lenta]MCM3110054.1 hypothetical protein [Lederbergia lenta]
MKIQITSTNVKYNTETGEISGVQVHFSGRDMNYEVNISGYIPLKPEEYAGNEPINKLEILVKQSIVDRLLNDVPPVTE